MNTGNKGKFSERIKRIAFSRRNKNSDKELDENKGYLKRIILFPVMLIDKKIHENNNLSKVNNSVVNEKNSNKNISFKDTVNINKTSLNRKKTFYNSKKSNTLSKSTNMLLSQKQKNIENINFNFSLQKENKNVDKQEQMTSLTSSRKMSNTFVHNPFDPKKKESNSNIKVDKNNINLLNSSIVNDISKYLIKNINNLESLESDLYVLSKFDGNKGSLDKCREYIIKLQALQNKLNKIRKQFNILKVNTNFDNVLDIDDKNLLDKIVLFRNSIDSNIVKDTVKDYKLLEEYKYLYSKIDSVINKANDLEQEVINRKMELENANINFNDFQNSIYNFDKIENETSIMLQRQDEKLKKIADKVSDISVTKKVEYIYQGFLDLLFSSLKLMGLYMLSPFKNSIPGIAIATVATKKNVNNLIDSLNVEKRTKYIYSATNFSLDLASVIDNLESLDNLIVSTLSDLEIAKRDFISKFSPYASQLSKYNNTLKKLNQMERTMKNNQIKVRTLAEKTREKKRVNEKTLVKVRKLNK